MCFLNICENAKKSIFVKRKECLTISVHTQHHVLNF